MRPVVIEANDGTVHVRRRQIVRTPWFGIYLHRILTRDFDRHAHDHPWPFVSLILRGGYVEFVTGDDGLPLECVRTRGSLHRMPVEKAHLIYEVAPNTLTLVLTGRHGRDWGYWTAEGWVSHSDYAQTFHARDDDR